jgi:hypothetical protein
MLCHKISEVNQTYQGRPNFAVNSNQLTDCKVIPPGERGSVMIRTSNGSSVNGAGRSHSLSLSCIEAATSFNGASAGMWVAVDRTMTQKCSLHQEID